MANWLTNLWQRSHNREARAQAEVDRIAALKYAAKTRRAEYAEEKERAVLTESVPLPSPLALSRKRVEDAEAAYAHAIQAWNNKQWGYKTR